MIRFIRPMHATEDDLAPIDYSYVPSVSEGRRREQMKKIHREDAASGPIVRHRAEPQDASDLPEYRVHPVRGAQSTATARDTVMRRLPSMADGPAPAQRAAYPPGYHHEGKEDYGLPEDPFNPPADTQQRRRRAQQPAPVQPSRSGEGERFVLPQETAAEIPDWLRVAQQNNMPMERPDTPVMQPSAQRQEQPELDALGRPVRHRQSPVLSPYEEAGYPEELIQAQRAWEAEQSAQPVRRRHGAQYAVNPHRAARNEKDAQRRAEADVRLPWERSAPLGSPPQRGAVPQGLRGTPYSEQQQFQQEATPPSAYAATSPLRRGGEGEARSHLRSGEGEGRSQLRRSEEEQRTFAPRSSSESGTQAPLSSPPQRGAVPQGLRGNPYPEQQQFQQEVTPPSAYAATSPLQRGGEGEGRSHLRSGEGEGRSHLRSREEEQRTYAPRSSEGATRREASAQPSAPDTYAPDGSVYAPPAQLHYQEPEPMRRKRPEPQDVPDDGWHVEDDEEREPIALPAWLTRVPWLGIGAFVSVLAAILLWIMGSNYEKDIQLVLAAREAQEIAIADKHPLKYESLIDEKAYKYNLSPAFVAAIMLNESSFRPDATASSTGAKGLMQLMDETSEWVHGKLDWPEPYNPQDLYIPEVNAEFGCWYLNYLSEEFRGDPILVAAAYHAGQNNVHNWLNTSAYSPDGRTLAIDKIPFDDTRRYVTRVMNNYAAYKRLYYGG